MNIHVMWQQAIDLIDGSNQGMIFTIDENELSAEAGCSLYGGP